MKNVILLNKKVGQTPLEAIQEFQKNNPEYESEKLTYAGRLDPMAEGLLIVLAGEEIKNKEKYMGLDKEYEFEVLFGVETDTYDILGVLSPSLRGDEGDEAISNVRLLHSVRNDVIKELIGEKVQPYPPYSSKTVHGKPLFEYARENRLSEIEIPSRLVEIYSITVLDDRQITSEELKKHIADRVNVVMGDFRQEEIIDSWNTFLNQNTKNSFHVLRCVARVSSGTYIRSLAHEIGKKMRTGAIALSIKRTKVGSFSMVE